MSSRPASGLNRETLSQKPKTQITKGCGGNMQVILEFGDLVEPASWDTCPLCSPWTHTPQKSTGRVRILLPGPTAEWKTEPHGGPASYPGRGVGRDEIQSLTAALGGALPSLHRWVAGSWRQPAAWQEEGQHRTLQLLHLLVWKYFIISVHSGYTRGYAW
jgi:hypothetical protein